MKRNLIFLILIATIFSSCKKKYWCVCKETDGTVYRKVYVSGKTTEEAYQLCIGDSPFIFEGCELEPYK